MVTTTRYGPSMARPYGELADPLLYTQHPPYGTAAPHFPYGSNFAREGSPPRSPVRPHPYGGAHMNHMPHMNHMNHGGVVKGVLPGAGAHSGSVEVTVFEAVPTGNPKWCLAPSVQLELARQRQETRVTRYNEKPTWGQAFVFYNVKISDKLHIVVRDAAKHLTAATGTVSGQTVVSKAARKLWVTLRDSSSLPVAKLLIGVRDTQVEGSASVLRNLDAPEAYRSQAGALRRSNSVPSFHTRAPRPVTAHGRSLVGVEEKQADLYNTRTHTIQVVRAVGLPMARPNRSNSAYAELRVGRKKQQTATKLHQGTAVWGDILHFAAHDEEDLYVRLIDSTHGRAAELGTCTIRLQDLATLGDKQLLEVDLMDAKGRPAGTVVLRGSKTKMGNFPDPREGPPLSHRGRASTRPGPLRPESPLRRPDSMPHIPSSHAEYSSRPLSPIPLQMNYGDTAFRYPSPPPPPVPSYGPTQPYPGAMPHYPSFSRQAALAPPPIPYTYNHPGTVAHDGRPPSTFAPHPQPQLPFCPPTGSYTPGFVVSSAAGHFGGPPVRISEVGNTILVQEA